MTTNSSTETPEIMPCGHPRACLICTDEGTHHCAWCEDIAHMSWALKRAIERADDFRELIVEYEREITGLKAEANLNAAMLAQQCDLARETETALSRERMRATVGGGSVL